MIPNRPLNTASPTAVARGIFDGGVRVPVLNAATPDPAAKKRPFDLFYSG